MAWVSRSDDARLDSLYDGDGFGGDKTMRAMVIRELIDQIRALRHHLAELDVHSETSGREGDS
jgi:hypothetical protein